MDFQETVRERTGLLTEVLQIYALEHPHIGYRQGMHEIASYLMMVIEMDLFDAESQHQRPTELLMEASIKDDTYHMLCSIMGSLGRAYDVKTSTTPSTSPMEVMAQSILHKIRDVAGDKVLYQHLQSLQCPPELYCTRWVRLMFSREVKGWRNVLQLWDIFLDLISSVPLQSMKKERYTRPGVAPPLRLGDFSLMQVLEGCAASTILLQRASLLNPDNDTNDSIHTLMNVPPLKNILPLTATLLSMMRRVQLHGNSPNGVVSASPMTPQTMIQKSLSTLTQNAQQALNSTSRHVFGMTTGPAPTASPMASAATTNAPVPTTTMGGKTLPTIGTTVMSAPGSSGPQSVTDPLRMMAGVDASGDGTRSPIRSLSTGTSANSNSNTNSAAPSLFELANSLHDSVYVVKNYLGGVNSAGSPVPQSVWDALSNMERIQNEMKR